MGDLFFDLGNFSINNGISESAEELLLERYFGGASDGRARAAEADEDHVRLPRGDVGGRAAGHLDARLRLRGLRDQHFARCLQSAEDPRFDVARRPRAGTDAWPRARAVVIGGGVAGASIA